MSLKMGLWERSRRVRPYNDGRSKSYRAFRAVSIITETHHLPDRHSLRAAGVVPAYVLCIRDHRVCFCYRSGLVELVFCDSAEANATNGGPAWIFRSVYVICARV